MVHRERKDHAMTTSIRPSTIESVLVVGTHDGLHVPHRSEPILRGRRIGALAVDGDSGWALVDSVELHRVMFDGASEHIATLAGGSANCVHVHDGTVFVGGDDAALWRV